MLKGPLSLVTEASHKQSNQPFVPGNKMLRCLPVRTGTCSLLVCSCHRACHTVVMYVVTFCTVQMHLKEGGAYRRASRPFREHSISVSTTALSRCVSILHPTAKPSMAYLASSCICTSSPRSWACESEQQGGGAEQLCKETRQSARLHLSAAKACSSYTSFEYVCQAGNRTRPVDADTKH